MQKADKTNAGNLAVAESRDRTLTDIEKTTLCAEAMGLVVYPKQLVKGKLAVDGRGVLTNGTLCQVFDPLHDDAQAMALVKRFSLAVTKIDGNDGLWDAAFPDKDGYYGEGAGDFDLNRAIVECVAKMQAARVTDPSGITDPQTEAPDK